MKSWNPGSRPVAPTAHVGKRFSKERESNLNNRYDPVLESDHELVIGDARDMSGLPDESVELIVTSPPYPMIEMWDGAFRCMDPEISSALERDDGEAAFELMHRQLDRAWGECYRVLKPGCIACINVGDATRTLEGDFQLHSNHAGEGEDGAAVDRPGSPRRLSRCVG